MAIILTEAEQQIALLIRARYPFIYINTWEETRVIKSILRVNGEYSWNSRGKEARLNHAVYSWSQTEGMRRLGNSRSEDSEGAAGTKQALQAIDFIRKRKEDSIFILKDFHPYLRRERSGTAYEVVRALRDLLPLLYDGAHYKTVIFLSPTLVIPDEMQKEITVLDYPLPCESEIYAAFEELLRVNGVKNNLPANMLHEIASAARGMTLREAENAFSRAIIRQGGLTPDALGVIYEEKRQVIRKGGLLECVDSNIALDDIGGLDVLKEWLKKRRNSWGRRALDYMLPAPKGVLITGIPGCGKSLTAKAMSAIWGVPLIQLDMGRIYSGLVGSSEENMRRAIQTAEAMAPCVLWLDEIEKGLSGTGSSNDSGTATRVFGTLLTWMQEKKSMVFILATANDISGLRPELLRKGRFDEIFFVDLPTKKEREAIARVHVRRHMCEAFNGIALNDQFFSGLASLTQGFVGAEIEALIVNALFEAFSENRCLCAEDFRRAAANTVPLSTTQREQIENLRAWANTRAVAATSHNYGDGSPGESAGRILQL